MENNEVSKHIHTGSIGLMALTWALLVSLILLAACNAIAGSPTRAAPTAVKTLSPVPRVGNKTTPDPELSGTATPTTASGFDCAGVDQIPFTECAALVALYDSTNGPDWVDNSGWLTTNTPCSWTGISCTGDHVSHVSLSYNQLTGSLPPALGNLSHLQVVELGTNELHGPIPVTFGNLSKLDELDLSYNQLSGPIPESMVLISQRMLWGNQLEGTITADGQAPFTVDYMGVHFSADPSLATSIWPEMKPASPLPEVLEGPGYWLAIPEHLRFTFADPDLPLERRRMGFNLAAEGEILVFPLAELAGMNTLVPTKIGALRNLLLNLLLERGTVQAGDLPLLPLTNAAQVFHAQEEYLDSGYVQGLRFISQHSQDPHPIMLSQELFYTFQGFSDDGAYYVAAFFPINSAVLPDTIEIEDWEAFHANYDAYLAETTAELNQLPPSEFTPDLTLLDALVTSLRIKPGTLATGDLAYRLPIFVEQLPSVAPLELNIDPAAGLITYQKDRQLWLSQADLNGQPLKLAECIDQRKAICSLPGITWSPDGSHFFYETTVNGEHRLLISDLQGQQQGFRLSHLPSRDPVWSPDGNKIILFIVDSNRPWGDHSNPELSPLEIGFIEEVWQLQMEPSGIWLASQKVADLEAPGIGCGGGGGSTSDALYDIQGGFALGYQAARKMVWTNDDVIIYPLTCDYWQGYGRLDTQTWQPLAPYSGQLRGLTLDASGSRWYAVTGHNRDDDPASNRLVTGTADGTTYEVIETAVPVEMVFVGLQSGRLYYTSRELLEHKDLSEQIKWNKSVEPYFNFYHTQLWTILPDGTNERLLWESDVHSISRVTETMRGDLLFVLIENDVALYETIAGGAPEEEWIEHLPHTHIMRLSFSSNEPEIWLEDAHSLTTWYPAVND